EPAADGVEEGGRQLTVGPPPDPRVVGGLQPAPEGAAAEGRAELRREALDDPPRGLSGEREPFGGIRGNPGPVAPLEAKPRDGPGPLEFLDVGEEALLHHAGRGQGALRGGIRFRGSGRARGVTCPGGLSHRSFPPTAPRPLTRRTARLSLPCRTAPLRS